MKLEDALKISKVTHTLDGEGYYYPAAVLDKPYITCFERGGEVVFISNSLAPTPKDTLYLSELDTWEPL